MTSGALIRWSRLHDRRARRGWWTSPWLGALIAGGGLALFVAARADSGVAAGSHAWLACTLAAFALAFMRVPFHLYWRADAALLAQLPIEGGALLDAALVRCLGGAAATTLATVLGALPLLHHPRLFVHHAVLAGVLGLTAACCLPSVAVWAAMLVVAGRTDRGVRAVQVATALAGGGAPTAGAADGSGTVLGALPGFASSVVVVIVILAAPWLDGKATAREVAPLLGSLALGSVLSLVVIRMTAPRRMGTILRDVSALDRQRLARLEIHPPTAIERAVGRLLGEAALPYRKDVRLMRRRYPMAFALGALVFIVLAILGLARPDDPAPWLIAVLGGAAIYGVALTGRLYRAPVELPRLAATLPIPASARTRAKVAWVITWWLLFVLVPAAFVLARIDRPELGLALLGAGTSIVLASARRRLVSRA